MNVSDAAAGRDATSARSPLVSVVVCTFNRSGMLSDALQTLCRLTTLGRFSYEIVVVDNASTDDTHQTILDFERRSNGLVRGVYESTKGIAAARNRGVYEAAGSWIAFFDDDQLADSLWLVRLLEMADLKSVRVVGGAVHLNMPAEEAAKIPAICRMLLGESLGRGTGNKPFAYGRNSPGTGNLMLHRSVFKEVGYFDETLTSAGEDTDLYRRIRSAGIAAWYTPDAIVHHMIPAERTTTSHLCWTATRIGSHVARRERKEGSLLRFLGLAAGRAVKFLAVTTPSRALSMLQQDPWKKTASDCRWAMSCGYFRGVGMQLFPKTCGEKAFESKMGFRKEKPLLADSKAAAMSSSHESGVCANSSSGQVRPEVAAVQASIADSGLSLVKA